MSQRAQLKDSGQPVTLTSSGYSFHIFIFYSFFEDFVYCVLFIFALPITSTISIPDFLPDQLCVLFFFFHQLSSPVWAAHIFLGGWSSTDGLKREMLFNKTYIPFPAVVSCQENLRGAGRQVCLPVFILRLGLAWTCAVLVHAASTAVSSCMWLPCWVHRAFFPCAHLPTAFGPFCPLFCNDFWASAGGAVIERCPILRVIISQSLFFVTFMSILNCGSNKVRKESGLSNRR